MAEDRIQLEESWKLRLHAELGSPYMQGLKSFLQAEMRAQKKVYPEPSLYFNALNSTPFASVKVVILGQDPYHGPGQAHGLAFSVPPTQAVPPSLVNIFKELESDLGIDRPRHGCLQAWAQQGVLLLNSVLTVTDGAPASHQNRGWERFTDHIISCLSTHREHLVFMLWGAYAQRKGAVIDDRKHLVIKSTHPSPFSAHKGFLGSRPFSQANAYLSAHGLSPIHWYLPEETFSCLN